jgi:hypothetical protein
VLKDHEPSPSKQTLWATYNRDVAQIADRLPPKAREFALAPWHCDVTDHRCLHDAWIENIDVRESASGSRHENRSVEISIRFLGAYHDRHLTLRFSSVRRYSIERPLKWKSRQQIVGHGDVLEDAIGVDEEGYLAYSLRLEFGQIAIEAKDLEFSEEPF